MGLFRRSPKQQNPSQTSPAVVSERALTTEEDIRNAYRLVLKREPDPSGLAHYSDLAQRGLTIQDLVASLLASDEYRNGPAGRPATTVPAATTSASRDLDIREPLPTDSAAAHIGPKEVILRYSVEELIETADEYYRRVPDPTPLMSKPFSFLHETPEMTQNVGLLLAGLHLGKTMTVLDFGAGTCWLSRILAQLNCQPICCDASGAALAIGKRLFDEHPLIGTTVYRPRFLLFDGYRIDLPDESVDRIVCFDALHHVPNPDRIIAELGRVLKDGGIAGFSEPGRKHSQSPQAQYEMRDHRVLENDVDLNEIFGFARTAQFTGLTVKVLNDLELDLEDYNAIFVETPSDSLRLRIWNDMRNTMFSRSVFFLHKGPVRLDSRSHVGLAHSLRPERTEYSLQPGEPLRVAVTIQNTGRAWWLNTNTEIFGIVRLASHLYDGQGKLLDVDHSRHDLPSAVAPGESVTMSVDIQLPEMVHCRIALDLVAEGVSWFENLGSSPAYLNVFRR